jgi:DNA-binding NtrC family response regulator
VEVRPQLDNMNVVIIGPDKTEADHLRTSLNAFGAKVFMAGSLEEAAGLFRRKQVHALLADIRFMDEHSEEFIRTYKAENPEGQFYLLIDPETTVTSTDSSALLVDDYLQKPVDAHRLALSLTSGASSELAVVDPLISRVRPYFRFRSEAMRQALENLPRIAASRQTVLVTGETGTGKEIISRSVHMMSSRASGPFVTVNCGAIPETLIEGELFGHEKGAFTGADHSRKGHGGTLFLDEIGDMPLQLQVRLLRALEEEQITRLGGETPIPIDVRVICATARGLRDAVNEKLFREDLYYRLNVLRIELPPLRERVEDISILAVHFMDRTFTEMGWPEPWPKLSTAAIDLLERLAWPGNVRELRNVMTRVATLLPRDARQVLPMHVAPHLEPPVGEAPSAPTPRPRTSVQREGVFIPTGTTIDEAEMMIIEEALRATGGNRTRAAGMLGIGLRTIRRRLNQ